MRNRRLRIERLETRRLLAVDLNFADISDGIVFVDQFGRSLEGAADPTPVDGQLVYVAADWSAMGLSGSDSYVVRFGMDGALVDVALGGGDFPYRFHGGWVARPGANHTITVTLDADQEIPEDDESNNSFSLQFATAAPTSLPQRFVHPVAGVENVDWILTNYLDVDPESCFECAEDFRGNTSLTRDFHNGVDIGLVNFAHADRGVEVRAAAAGTVVHAQDGHFDRWFTFQFPFPEGNRVFVDHGGGWVTQYYHLQRGSVTVDVGDSVSAGQVLGMVGSSGFSAGPHLHFEVQRHDLPVEPFLSPDAYFVSPAQYAYDVDPVFHDLGVATTFPFLRDVIELPSDNDGLPASAVSLFPWVILSSVKPGDAWELKLMQPDGTEFVQPAFAEPIAFTGDIGGSWQWNRWWNVFLENPVAGTWEAQIYVNSVMVGSESFVIGRDLPEIRIIEDVNGNNEIEFDEPLLIDGRKTPVDFGHVSAGSTDPIKHFIVENHGFAELTISAVELPNGFSMVEPLEEAIAAGDADQFSIALDAATVGLKSGMLRIRSNDRLVSDFDGDGDVDGRNFLQWQQGVGLAAGATESDGDADGSGVVDGDDRLHWERQFGTPSETVLEIPLEGEVTQSSAALAGAAARSTQPLAADDQVATDAVWQRGLFEFSWSAATGPQSSSSAAEVERAAGPATQPTDLRLFGDNASKDAEATLDFDWREFS